MFFRFTDNEETIVNIKEIEYIKNNGTLTITIYMLRESIIYLNYKYRPEIDNDITRFMKATNYLTD